MGLERYAQTVKVFAPATVANLSCGFDVLGLALESPGDSVEVSLSDKAGVEILSIEGDQGKLPLEPVKNTSGVAISQFVQLCIQKGISLPASGFSVRIKKGLPLGSGMGSSAASSVAALIAANELCGTPFERKDLLSCAMEAEKAACGSAHADNVGPCLLGGIVLIRSYDPLDVIPLDFPPELCCVVVSPHIELKTSDARRVLRKHVRLSDAIQQWGNLAGLVTGLLKHDFDLISRSLVDNLIEPERAILIPGFYAVKRAAVESGALGCSISGAGPSTFALVSSRDKAVQVASAMQEQFLKIGINSSSTISAINRNGATILR